MTTTIDRTHAAALRSWVESANDAANDFPIQNLPLGVFTEAGDRRPRIGVAIGNSILDLDACARAGLLGSLDPSIHAVCCAGSLNELFALGRAGAAAIRLAVSDLLSADSAAGAVAAARRDEILRPSSSCAMQLPGVIGDYSDFYASVQHASNVGSMFRPDNPLLPNYKWVPIGYHGRASSIVPSGTRIRRPVGQTRTDQNAPPIFGPANSLDYELEVGAFVGAGNALGEPISIAEARDRLFGLCLVNDWSARDIQAWEYQPLGPFLAKSFATTISPWIVTLEALEPFRAPVAARAEGDPAPLEYLTDSRENAAGAFDIVLEVSLCSARMRDAGMPPVVLVRSRFRELYWTLGQMVAHHTSNGCNLRPGDLLASGTVSNAAKESRGCLLELTWRGQEPVSLPGGETRKFLEDGDEVIMRGSCEREGFRRIGFGECRGVVEG